MELIKSVAQRSKVSDIVYVALNVVLVVAMLVLTVAFQPPLVAYAIVLLSKWRIFAVKPRFWWANLQTNMVDILVGVSVVSLIWQATGAFVAQLLLAMLYLGWLLMVKPRSSRKYMLIQAGVSQFLSLTALFSVAHYLDAFFVVLASFVIGYVAARHVLLGYEDTDSTVLAGVWGFFIAELCWLGYHWAQAYALVANLMIPQVAIIAGLTGFVVVRFYDAKTHGAKLSSRLRAPILFSVAILAILLLRELSDIFTYTS